MKSTFACKDVGLQCDFVSEASSREELMPKIMEHAKNAHGMTEIPEDLKNKVVGAIKTHD